MTIGCGCGQSLTRERLLELAKPEHVRVTLTTLDQAFHDAMRRVVVEPDYDYQFYLRELAPVEVMQGEFGYTERHLDTVRMVLDKAASLLGTAENVRFVGYSWIATTTG